MCHTSSPADTPDDHDEDLSALICLISGVCLNIRYILYTGVYHTGLFCKSLTLSSLFYSDFRRPFFHFHGSSQDPIVSWENACAPSSSNRLLCIHRQFLSHLGDTHEQDVAEDEKLAPKHDNEMPKATRVTMMNAQNCCLTIPACSIFSISVISSHIDKYSGALEGRILWRKNCGCLPYENFKWKLWWFEKIPRECDSWYWWQDLGKTVKRRDVSGDPCVNCSWSCLESVKILQLRKTNSEWSISIYNMMKSHLISV